jgi:hypothetical protein
MSDQADRLSGVRLGSGDDEHTARRTGVFTARHSSSWRLCTALETCASTPNCGDELEALRPLQSTAIVDAALGAQAELAHHAGGAPDVGDVELLLEIDEPRDRAQQTVDAYYRRAHPYTEVVKALGCSRGSIVRVAVTPVFSRRHR